MTEPGGRPEPGDEGSSRLLASQRAYYDLRAADYGDESRPGDRLVRGEMPAELVRATVAGAGLEGDVLELACGPGAFTGELAGRAGSVTAVDASPRMLERNRREVAAPNVRYIEADVFAWEPERVYDGVFFGFWLSHVPPDRFDRFWALVARCLGPAGRVAFVDEDERAATHDETRWVGGTPAARRTLADGRAMDIVKVFWPAAALEQRLRAGGWDVTVRRTGPTFLYGAGRPPA